MQITLPLENMTTDEKLALVDEILSSIKGQNTALPAWHKTVLREREERASQGLAQYADWEVVKKRLLVRLSQHSA